MVASLGTETLTTDKLSCSCCHIETVMSTLEPKVVPLGDELGVAWICPACLDASNATGGAIIQNAARITVAALDALLMSAYRWLDSKLLGRNGRKLYIRRPTFAESQKAIATGVVLPGNSAVVVTPQGDSHLRRRLMPMPFPWMPEEWWAGPVAAQSAVDLADAIERGEVDMVMIGENAMFSASTETLERLVRS